MVSHSFLFLCFFKYRIIASIFPLEPRDALDVKNKKKNQIEFIPYAVPSMFFPAWKQFFELEVYGFQHNFHDTEPGVVTMVHVYNLILSADTLARDKHNSFASHNSLCGCSICAQLFKIFSPNGSKISRIDAYIPSADFLQCKLRDNVGVLEDGLKWLEAKSKSAAKRILSRNGCRLSLLHNMMPSFDLSCGSPFEFSHGLIHGMFLSEDEILWWTIAWTKLLFFFSFW